MNLPNALTLGRIFLVPLLVVVLLTKFEGRQILGVSKELVGVIEAAVNREVDAARHSGVVSLFQQHFIKPGLVAPEVGKILARAFEKRQNSDYEDFATVDPADA